MQKIVLMRYIDNYQMAGLFQFFLLNDHCVCVLVLTSKDIACCKFKSVFQYPQN